MSLEMGTRLRHGGGAVELGLDGGYLHMQMKRRGELRWGEERTLMWWSTSTTLRPFVCCGRGEWQREAIAGYWPRLSVGFSIEMGEVKRREEKRREEKRRGGGGQSEGGGGGDEGGGGGDQVDDG